MVTGRSGRALPARAGPAGPGGSGCEAHRGYDRQPGGEVHNLLVRPTPHTPGRPKGRSRDPPVRHSVVAASDQLVHRSAPRLTRMADRRVVPATTRSARRRPDRARRLIAYDRAPNADAPLGQRSAPRRPARVAQPVEQRTRNAQVRSSSLLPGSLSVSPGRRAVSLAAQAGGTMCRHNLSRRASRPRPGGRPRPRSA